MTQNGQAASGNSPTPSGNPTPASTDWEAKSRELEQQLRAVSGERNRFKQERDDAMTQMSQYQTPQAQYGAQAGGYQGQQGYVSTVNPWQDVGIDANQANAWYQQNFQALAAQQGFVTQQQAEQLAAQARNEAYQMANQRFSTMRSVDKLLSDPLYKDLSNTQSEWSKRTAAYLQQYNAGQPTRDGAGWDEWNYTAPQVLQQAADIAWAQMSREQSSSQASQQQAIQAQQAAGLSAPASVTPLPPNPSQQFEKTLQSGDTKQILDALAEKTEESFKTAGLLT